MSKDSFKIDKYLSIRPQASVPSDPVNGDIYYDSSTNQFKFYQDDAWINASGSSAWGDIAGTLTDQPDLIEELDNAANVMTKVRSGLDANGIFTVITYKRADDTKIMESTLSGGTPPEYTTRTVKYYESDGTTEIVSRRKVFTLSYTLGEFISEVLT